MTRKVQITLTLEQKQVDYLQAYALQFFDGNESMAARRIFAYHSLYVHKIGSD